MKRSIKFDLPINATTARDLDALRANFTVEILDLHVQGVLLKWVRNLGQPGLEAKLQEIAPVRNGQVLLELAGALGGKVSPAMLHGADGVEAPLGAAESACKEKYDSLTEIVTGLRLKHYCLTRAEYDAFAKQLVDAAHGRETHCVMFDDALFEKVVPTGRYSTFTGNVLHPKARVAVECGFRFRFAKNKGDLVTAGEPVGRLYPDDLGVGIWVQSPVSGVLVEFGEGEIGGAGVVYRLDSPLFYVAPRESAELHGKAVRNKPFFGLF